MKPYLEKHPLTGLEDYLADSFAVWCIEEGKNPHDFEGFELFDRYEEFLNNFLVGSYKYIYRNAMERYNTLIERS